MYLHWQEKTIIDLSPRNVQDMYELGFVFTRLGKGVMHQTRSVRIDLTKFELSSENRRILKKVEGLQIEKISLPLALPSPLSKGGIEGGWYDWRIGKMAKDFYESRDAVFSVNKVKEILTDPSRANFNTLLTFTRSNLVQGSTLYEIAGNSLIGYVIGYESPTIFHYSYPFYDLSAAKDAGLGMMLEAIIWAKENGKKYFYLGSLQRPSDIYKLQFRGLEWFDGERWQSDVEEAKKTLNANN